MAGASAAPALPAADAGLRYRAFLSYSHADSAVCRRLHRRLEAFRVPRDLVAAGHAPRLAPVFRDREELGSSPSLSAEIEAALQASAALIVVGSPAACASRWVGEEVLWFRRHHPQRPVFAFVVAGDPAADPRGEARAALPLAVLLADPDRPEAGLCEPLAADARREADGFDAAFLKLVAGLLGVGLDRLRHRELRRRQRRWALLAGVSALAAVLFAGLAFQAMQARDAARQAQRKAELELASERQTRDFLQSIFDLADPGEARGQAITVREVLDRAVARIDQTRFDRPAIKSRYLAMLGRVYSSIGLNHRASELLAASLKDLDPDGADPADGAQYVDVQIEMADLAFDMGDLDAALQALDALEGTTRPLGAEQRARMAAVRGDVLSFMERDAEAEATYRAALEVLDGAGLQPGVEAALRGHGLYGMAQLAMFAGQHDRADEGFAEAESVLAAALGSRHPRTLSAAITRGTNAFQAGDKARARQLWTAALADAEAVFDHDSPRLGTLKNNLGRLDLEAGELERAESLLRDALRSDRLHRGAEFDDLAFPLANLAIVRFARGDAAEAEVLLREALPLARRSEHLMLGAILNQLADLQCSEERHDEGITFARQALDVSVRQHGEDDWRSAQAALTLAWCGDTAISLNRLAGQRRRLDAALPQGSPFRQRAARQWQVLSRRGEAP